MKQNVEMLMPYMIRARVPVVEDLRQLSAEQILSVLYKVAQDPMNLDCMGHVELVNLLERLRCEYYDLLSSEPDEESVLMWHQWRDDLSTLRGRIHQVQQRLAA